MDKSTNKGKLYSIGAVAKLMGIQPQLLRHYCDMGVITPEIIDEETGYRFFSVKQFPYIDRTRFQLRCGLSLTDIKAVLQSDNLDLLVRLLSKERKKKLEEIEKAIDCIKTIEWYESYFAYGNQPTETSSFSIKRFEPRYLLAAKCPDDYDPKDFYNLFNKIRYKEENKNLKLTRQVTVLLDYDALLHKEFKRYYVGRFAMGMPSAISPDIMKLPAGEYYCFWANIHNEDWDPNEIRIPLAERRKATLVIANEFETSFSEYNNNPHELQFYFNDTVLKM